MRLYYSNLLNGQLLMQFVLLIIENLQKNNRISVTFRFVIFVKNAIFALFFVNYSKQDI